MEDLETVETVAPEEGEPTIEEQDSQTPKTSEEEKELTDEELKEDISRLKLEISKEEDPKEKRHKEQEMWWKMKVEKERNRAKDLELKNRENEELSKTIENTLIEETYSKITSNEFWLPYFETLYKTNPKLADKVAKEKWDGKTAKQLILETKKQLADNWDDSAKQQVTEEEIRQEERDKIYEEIAIEEAQRIVDELDWQEHEDAVSYFEEIAEGKRLTPATAKKYAEMAIFYAIRNRKPEEKPALKSIEKEKILAGNANTGISPKSWTQETSKIDIESARQQLLNAWVTRYLVDQIYPLK